MKKNNTTKLLALATLTAFGLAAPTAGFAKPKKKKADEAKTELNYELTPDSDTAGNATQSAKSGKDSQKQAKSGTKPSTTIVKPGQGQSLGNSGKVGENLSGLDKTDLLTSSTSSKPRQSTATVEPTAHALEDIKRKAPILGMGVFRSEQLSGGEVNAPGIADFAAYFRASGGTATRAATVAPGNEGAARSSTTVQLGTSTQEELDRQGEAEKLRAETVESIRRIQATKPPTDQKFDLFMRLAEIQVERHAYFIEFEIKQFNEAHEKWKVSQKGVEPQFKTDKSTNQLLVGIESLRSAVTQFPNHQRTPEALFTLGFLLTQMHSDNAALYFDRLVSRFPKHELVPDAYVALGEYYFSKNMFEKALASYQKVLNYKGKPAYNYAVYKLGWTNFNIRPNDADTQKNLQKSLAAFRLVVKLAEAPNADKVLKGLRKEALKDMVLVFADIGDIDAAQKYYEGLGEPELYFTLLERLAWQNAEAGKYNEAIKIYERLIAEGPLQNRLPLFYAKMAELNEKSRNRPQLLKTLTLMATALAPESAWMKHHSKDKETIAKRNKTLGGELKGWAEKFHAEAQKHRRENTYDDALVAYNIYLDNFGEQPESYKAHFFKAEILVHKGKYLEAADSYMKAAAIDEKNSLKGKFTRDGLLNAIAALDVVLAKAQQPKLPESGQAKEAIPLTALHARLVKALDTFVRMAPNDEKLFALSHRAALIVYAFGDYPNANERWTTLGRRFPKSKEIYDGARLVMKVFVDRQDWKTSIEQSRKFLAINGIKETKLGEELTAVLKGSVFQMALQLEKQENRAEAAALFLAYHKEFQADSDAPKALFNAANNKFRLGKMDDAITTLRILIAQYPQSELAPNVLYLIGSSYDSLGQFTESAASFEQLATEYPKTNVSPEALERSIVQRIATGEFDHAIKNATIFTVQYPNNKEIPEVLVLQGKAHSKMSNFKESAKVYARSADSANRTRPAYAAFALGLSAEAALRGGDREQASRTTTLGLAQLSTITNNKEPAMGEASRLLGVVQLALLDKQVVEVYKKTITDPLKLTDQFTKIRDEVQVLAQKYVSIAKLGNAEAGIGALYRVAEMQEFLATTLLKSPVPQGAKPEEIEQFKGTLERIALPLQEEAVGLYVKAWDKANETEAITPYTRKLQEKLVSLRPSEFRRVIEDMAQPAYYASDIVLTPETRALVKK